MALSTAQQANCRPTSLSHHHVAPSPLVPTRRALHIRHKLLCNATAIETQAVRALSQSKQVVAEIEKTSWTSRRLYASVSIQAPVPVVWGCLTDYERLSNFIPSLVENYCLRRKRNGAVLKQIGAQEVAMGVNFCAACTLDCTEYLQGVPDKICSQGGSGKDSLLPYPRNSLPGVTCQDIAFEQVEGDFTEFRGIWRMQPQPSANGEANEQGTLLCYSLFVRPKPWLPVGLIQDRIEKEVVRNLEAVRKHAEYLHKSSSSSS